MTTSEGALSPETDRDVDAMLSVAIQFVVAVAVWGAIGLVLDLVLPFSPWLHFGGVLFGVFVGLALARRQATPLDADAAHG